MFIPMKAVPNLPLPLEYDTVNLTSIDEILDSKYLYASQFVIKLGEEIDHFQVNFDDRFYIYIVQG